MAAVGAGCSRFVGPGHAATVLRELFAFAPVADEDAVGWHAHRAQRLLLDACGQHIGQIGHLCLGAGQIGCILLQPIDFGDALIAERAAHHLRRQRIVIGRRRHRSTSGDQQHRGGQRDSFLVHVDSFSASRPARSTRHRWRSRPYKHPKLSSPARHSPDRGSAAGDSSHSSAAACSTFRRC